MKKIFPFLSIVLLVSLLAACGGGGGSGGANSSTGSPSTPVNTVPTIALSLQDLNGVAIKTLSGGDVGNLSAKFVSSAGIPIEGALVTFSGSSNLVVFNPSTGTAVTGADGVATVKVKSSDVSSSGAVALSVQGVKGLLSANATVNVTIGAASVTLGTLSFTPTQSAPLPAFSTVVLNIPVTINGSPATTISGLTLSSQCVADRTASLVPGPLSSASGIYTVTYTNQGCLRGTDLVSVSIGNSSKNISLNVDSANIGSMLFVGTDTSGSSIVLKGTGGAGRKESAVVTFKVVDQTNVGLAGVVVNFVPTATTGGLTVLPATATTDASGNVSTTVSSGTIPTPVKVSATATRNGKTVSGLSDDLTISTGLPIQRSMSMSVDSQNIEGLSYDNEIARVTVLMADQYGNLVSDGTTLNFVTEGGAIGSSSQGACSTTNGACTVPFRSQNFRPVNGRVTVLAYAQGIEDFIDTNGDGRYSCTNPVDVNGIAVSQANYRPLIDVCPSGSGEQYRDLGDAFLDAGELTLASGVSNEGTLDKLYDPIKGDLPFPYRNLTYSATGDARWGINYIRASTEIILSGSNATLIRQVCASGSCRDWIVASDGDPFIIQGVAGPGCSSQELTFRLVDVNNNPLPSKTKVSAGDVDNLALGTIFPSLVPSTNQIGGTQHSVLVKAETLCKSGSIRIDVVTPKGNGTSFLFRSN